MNNIIDIYGDESAASDVTVYGILAGRTEANNNLEEYIESEKKRLKIPIKENLHCKILFHSSKRKKSNFSHLSINDVIGLYRNIAFR